MTLKEKADYIFGIPDSMAKTAWFNLESMGGGLREAAEIANETKRHDVYCTKFMVATKSGNHRKASMLQMNFTSKILSKLVLKFGICGRKNVENY